MSQQEIVRIEKDLCLNAIEYVELYYNGTVDILSMIFRKEKVDDYSIDYLLDVDQNKGKEAARRFREFANSL